MMTDYQKLLKALGPLTAQFFLNMELQYLIKNKRTLEDSKSAKVSLTSPFKDYSMKLHYQKKSSSCNNL